MGDQILLRLLFVIALVLGASQVGASSRGFLKVPGAPLLLNSARNGEATFSEDYAPARTNPPSEHDPPPPVWDLKTEFVEDCELPRSLPPVTNKKYHLRPVLVMEASLFEGGYPPVSADRPIGNKDHPLPSSPRPRSLPPSTKKGYPLRSILDMEARLVEDDYPPVSADPLTGNKDHPLLSSLDPRARFVEDYELPHTHPPANDDYLPPPSVDLEN